MFCIYLIHLIAITVFGYGSKTKSFNLQYCGVLIRIISIISISMNLLKDHDGCQNANAKGLCLLEVVVESGFLVVWMGKNWYTWLWSKFMVNRLDEQNEFSPYNWDFVDLLLSSSCPNQNDWTLPVNIVYRICKINKN